MSIAINSTGTLLKVGDAASPEVFTTIPGVHRCAAPDVKTDMNDVSAHDSVGAFREWLPGLHDGDTINNEMWFKPSNTVHKNLRIDAYASTNRNFKIVFPDISDNTCLFAAYISSLPPQANVGEPLRCTMALKVTGLPVWS